MISMLEMTRRLRAKWERACLMNVPRRKRSGNPLSFLELLEPRQLLSASPVGSPVQIDTGSSNGVLAGDVDRIADGRSVAVWREDVEEAAQVFAQRFDASGVPAGPVIEVAEDFAGDAAPAVAMADDGQFVVVWVSDDTLIVGRRFQADGSPVDEEFDIGEVAGVAPNIVVDIDMDADGDFVVVWAAGPSRAFAVGYEAYEESAVFARRYAKTGTPVEIEFRVDTPTADDVYLVANPKVAVDADGDFAVGYTAIGENYETKVVTTRYSGETYTEEYEVLVVSKTDAIVRKYAGKNFVEPAVAGAPQVVLTNSKAGTVVNLQDVDLDTDGDMLVTVTRDSYKTKKVRYSGSTYEYLELKRSEMLVQRFSSSGGKTGKLKRLVKTKKHEQISDSRTSFDNDGDFVVAFKSKEAPYLSVGSTYDARDTGRTTRRQAPHAFTQMSVAKGQGRKKDESVLPDRLLVQQFSTKNKKVGEAVQLLSVASEALTSFSIAGQGAGELSVVWTLGTVGEDAKLFGQQVQS